MIHCRMEFVESQGVGHAKTRRVARHFGVDGKRILRRTKGTALVGARGVVRYLACASWGSGARRSAGTWAWGSRE